MLQNLRKKQEGFTIIEVMIVLIIAAVILLIVFLAIPALQRNSRNTQLRNDVAAVLAGITEFQNNNDGRMPNDIATLGNRVAIAGPTGTSTVQVQIQQGHTFTDGTSMPPTTGNNVFQNVVIRFGVTCNGNTFGNASPRAVAAGYNVEGAGNPTPQCESS